MLRDDLFNLLALRLGRRTDLVSRMETELALLQDIKLEQNPWLPWFLITEIAETTTTANEERIAVPDDFLAEVEEDCLWLYDTTQDVVWYPLKKMDHDDLRRKYPEPGRPKAYALINQYFVLGPVPDEEFTIKMKYYAQDVSPTTNIQNQWLKYAADVVIAELGQIMAGQHMQNTALAETFKTAAAEAWNRLYTQHVARTEANQSRVMEA